MHGRSRTQNNEAIRDTERVDMEFDGSTLVIDRTPSELAEILDEEDTDIVVERLSEERTMAL